jgi:hypothetical protein
MQPINFNHDFRLSKYLIKLVQIIQSSDKGQKIFKVLMEKFVFQSNGC